MIHARSPRTRHQWLWKRWIVAVSVSRRVCPDGDGGEDCGISTAGPWPGPRLVRVPPTHCRWFLRCKRILWEKEKVPKLFLVLLGFSVSDDATEVWVASLGQRLRAVWCREDGGAGWCRFCLASKGSMSPITTAAATEGQLHPFSQLFSFMTLGKISWTLLL